MGLKEEFPRNFNVENTKQDMYHKLKNEYPPFKGKTTLSVFLYSMALGYSHGLSKELEDSYVLVNTDSMSEEDAWLVASIAIDEEGLEVLNDATKIKNIAEEYSNGGINILQEKLESVQAGNELEKLSNDISNILEK